MLDDRVERRIHVANEVFAAIAIRIGVRVGGRICSDTPTDFKGIGQSIAVGIGARRQCAAGCVPDVYIAIVPGLGLGLGQILFVGLGEVDEPIIVIVVVFISISFDDLAENHASVAGGGG